MVSNNNNNIQIPIKIDIANEGEFRGAANNSAIIDRAGVSISTQIVIPDDDNVLLIESNKPCLSKSSFHARSAEGTIVPSGNRFHLNYGKASSFQQVPEAIISLFSGRVPLTCAQLNSVLRALTP